MLDRIVIGTDGQGAPAFLQQGDRAHTVFAGADRAQRRQALRSVAESVSAADIPVLMTDTQGRLSSLATTVPCTLWDIHGTAGLPLRTTVTELGPTLLSWLLGLNERQGDLLQLMFRIADDNGLLLIDTRDLKALLNELTGNAAAYAEEYGTVNRQTAGAVMNAIVSLETKGAQDYLFEPAIDVGDFLFGAEPSAEDTAEAGQGIAEAGRVHLIDARMQEDEQTLYACFLLFLLGELYEREDAGPLVILIDEAQLFFGELPDTLKRRLGRILEALADREVSVCAFLPAAGELPEALETVFRQRWIIGGSGLTLTGETPQTQAKAQAAGGEMLADSAEQILLTAPAGADRALPESARAVVTASDPLYEKYRIPFDRDSAYEFLKRRGLIQEGRAADGAVPSAQMDADAETDVENTVETSAKTGAGSLSVEETGEITAAEAAEIVDAKEESSDSEKDIGETSADTAADGENRDQTLQEMAKRAKTSTKSLGTTVAGTVGRKIGKSIGSSFGDFGETLGGNIGASLGRGIINTLFKT